MADRIRIVELDRDRGRISTVYALDDAPNVYPLRDTFRLGGGNPSLQIAGSNRARRAGRAYGRADEARQVAGSWRIKGSSASGCIDRLEEFLSRVAGVSRPGRYLEWRPTGHPVSAYWDMLGPAQWNGAYRAIEFDQAVAITVELTFPVDGDAYGSPWNVFEDWTDTTLAEWTKATDALVLALAADGDLNITDSSPAGQSSLWLHEGRNTPPLIDDEVILTYVHDANVRAQAVLSNVQATNTRIVAYYWNDAGAGRVTVDVERAGGVTITGSTGALAVPVAGDTYAIRLTRSELGIDAAVYRDRADPMSVPIASGGPGHIIGHYDDLVIPVDGLDDVALAGGGEAGFRIVNPAGAPTVWRLLSFRRRPLTFRPFDVGNGDQPSGHRADLIRNVPGTIDGPAAELEATIQPARRSVGGLGSLPFGLLAWAAVDRYRNMVQYGDPFYYDGVWMPGFIPAESHIIGVAGGAGLTAPAGANPIAGVDKEYVGLTTGAAGQGFLLMPATPSTAYAARHLKRGRPYTLSVEMRRLDGGSGNVTVGIGDRNASIGWAPQTNVVNTQNIGPTAWTRVNVTIVPTADRLRVHAWIAPAAAVQLAVRNIKLFEGRGANVDAVQTFDGYPPIGPLYPFAGLRSWGSSPSGVTVNADFIGANIPMTAGELASNNMYGEWVIKTPPAMFPDFGQPLVVEVFAELSIGSYFTQPILTAMLSPLEGGTGNAAAFAPIQYAQPHGAAGMALVKPVSGTSVRRMFKIGALTIEPGSGRQRLTVRLNDPAFTGTGNTAILHSVFLAPVHSRISMPTGRQPDSSYPHFMPTVAQGERARVIHPDLSSSLEVEGIRRRYASASISGEPPHLPAGRDVLLATLLTARVPNDPTLDSTGMSVQANGLEVQAGIRPRYNLAALLDG